MFGHSAGIHEWSVSVDLSKVQGDGGNSEMAYLEIIKLNLKVSVV